MDNLSSEQYKIVKLDVKRSGDICVSGWGLRFITDVSSLKIHNKIGNTPRKIEFPNGAIGYSSEHDKIDKILKIKPSKFSANNVAKFLYNIVYYTILFSSVTVIIAGLYIVELSN
jgi:hypothetical protein